MVFLATPLFADLDTLRADLEREGIRRETKNAIFYIERGSLAPRDTAAFASLFDKGIDDIRRFTGIQRAADAPKVSVYIAHDIGISRTFPRIPRMFIDARRVADRDAPYLHESVHAIAGDGGAAWLEEGFAEYVASAVADQYGGYYAPVLSEDNAHVDEQAKEFADSAEFPERAPALRDSTQRTRFYIAAHSFAKFLSEKLGVRRLARIHRENDPAALSRSTGKSLSAWRADWRAAINER